MNKKSIAKLLSLSVFLSMSLSTCYAGDPPPSLSILSTEERQTLENFFRVHGFGALNRVHGFGALNRVHGFGALNDEDLNSPFERPDPFGNSHTSSIPPLIDAVMDNELKAVQALIHAGANVNVRDNGNMTALMVAVIVNDAKIVQELINSPGIELNLQNNDGDTALMIAVRCNSGKVAQLLINAGADVTIPNIKGETALSIAEQGLDVALSPNIESYRTIVDLIKAKQAENESRGHMAQ